MLTAPRPVSRGRRRSRRDVHLRNKKVEVYEIAMHEGSWRATWKADPQAVLTADAADGLRNKIRADYARWTAHK